MDVKYNRIGTGYNDTRKADSYLTGRLLHHLGPKQDALYLDIGCGTGNYTHALSTKGLWFIGIDPSENMLNEARLKNDKKDWKLGEASETGLSNESIDDIIATLTIHHWPDLFKGFSELYRVLKPKGKMVIFTSTPKQMKGYWLNHYFPKMLIDSIKQMPRLEDLEHDLLAAGFSITALDYYFVRPDLKDLFLYAGKHNPKLYLDPNVRRGISSFASLSNKEEVAQGLLRMENDIANGTIEHIMDSYKNELGDYLFLVARKH